MVHGSRMAGGLAGALGRRGRGGGRRPRAPAGPSSHPWAMSHEPSTITNRLINELFDYILVPTGPKNPEIMKMLSSGLSHKQIKMI